MFPQIPAAASGGPTAATRTRHPGGLRRWRPPAILHMLYIHSLSLYIYIYMYIYIYIERERDMIML